MAIVQKYKTTGRYVVCPASGTNIHAGPQPVAVPIRIDRKGGFFSTCFCGGRNFHGPMWRSSNGITLDQAEALGAVITWRPNPNDKETM